MRALVAGVLALLTSCVLPLPRQLTPEERAADRDRCALVQAVMAEPTSRALLEALQPRFEGPVPLAVYVRRPEEGMLERFLIQELACATAEFRIVARAPARALLLYLADAPQGFTFALEQGSPEDLALEGDPQGRVVRAGSGWRVTGL